MSINTNDMCSKDIIIIILVLGMIYLLYKTRNIDNKENFSTSDDVKQAINDVYKADINAIRNLSNVATEIYSNNDTLTIPAKNTTVTDLSGSNASISNITSNNLTSDNANIKNITVDGNIIYTNKTNILGSLSDTNITIPSNGNILVYSDSKWINVPSIAGCYNGYLTGPWSTTQPANAVSGKEFEVPIAGNYVINVNASAFISNNTPDIRNALLGGYALPPATTPGFIIIEIYINGVNTNNLLKIYANEINSHKVLIPVSFKYALNKGTNYLFLRHNSGTSDSADFASFSYTYSP